jgi:hypothetical protein
LEEAEERTFGFLCALFENETGQQAMIFLSWAYLVALYAAMVEEQAPLPSM